ncbi:MAG: 5-formyltetrahydrofolate cyclo-ligase [Bacteroidaceae bacterium]
MISKQALRQQIKASKQATPAVTLNEWSQQAVHCLEEQFIWQQAKTVLLYYSMKDEVNTHNLVERAYKSGKIVYLPVMQADELILRPFTGIENMKTASKYKILEPTGDIVPPENYRNIDLVLVPGVAFTREGYRLGRGKGYYDNLLPHISAPCIGICWEIQLVNQLPTESHDVTLDGIISSNGIIKKLTK